MMTNVPAQLIYLQRAILLETLQWRHDGWDKVSIVYSAVSSGADQRKH